MGAQLYSALQCQAATHLSAPVTLPCAITTDLLCGQRIHIHLFDAIGPAGLACAARKAMKIAGDACIYTNHNQTGFHITKEGEIREAGLGEPAN